MITTTTTTTATTATSAMKSILLLSIVVLAAATPDPIDMSKGKENDNDGSRLGGPSGRIVGGDEADPGEFPYYVEMGGCGGALIAPDIVLFAAHCSSGFLDKQLNIGGYKKGTEAEGSRARFCEQWIPDPLYGSGGHGLNYDFALCKLDYPVAIDNDRYNVRFELNFEETIPETGDDLVVFGLGTTSSGGYVASTLRDVTVPYVTNEECNAPHRYNETITDVMLCAGIPDFGGKDACQGDSGGPLVKRQFLEDGTILDTHVGVVSWGIGCGFADYPGVYARTSARADWIKDTMCGHLESVSDLCFDETNLFDVGADAELYDEIGELTCDETQHKLVVDFTTDRYAYETAWQLRLEDTSAQVKHRKYLVNNLNYLTEVCLEANTCYEWEVRDSYGDGMCSNRGCGSYTLTLNGDETIAVGDGDFTTKLTESFCTGEAAIADSDSGDTNDNIDFIEPVSACDSNENLRFSVMFMTDNHPTETSFGAYLCSEDLTEIESPVFEIGEGSLTQERGLMILPNPGDFYCLENNRCYLFTINDSFGDGMSDGGGHYNGYLGNEQVFSGTGDFEFQEEHFFCTGTATLPPTTESPTASPSSIPTASPSSIPTAWPTEPVTASPTSSPTASPTEPVTASPTSSPTASPTESPTEPGPTESPTASPTESPTLYPTASPTESPTQYPTVSPTQYPTLSPTESPTQYPTLSPTESPTQYPTLSPTESPTLSPTQTPTVSLCMDDPDFRWKGKKNKTCERWLKEKAGSKKIDKKCNKPYEDGIVSDYCVATCAEKNDEEPCDVRADGTTNNEDGSKKKKKKKKKQQQERRKREFDSSDVDSIHA